MFHSSYVFYSPRGMTPTAFWPLTQISPNSFCFVWWWGEQAMSGLTCSSETSMADLGLAGGWAGEHSSLSRRRLTFKGSDPVNRVLGIFWSKKNIKSWPSIEENLASVCIENQLKASRKVVSSSSSFGKIMDNFPPLQPSHILRESNISRRSGLFKRPRRPTVATLFFPA